MFQEGPESPPQIPLDSSILTCYIVAERDAGMAEVGKIKRLILNKLRAGEGIPLCQLAVDAIHNLEGIIALVHDGKHSARAPGQSHQFPFLQGIRYELTLHEEAAGRHNIVSTRKSLPVGITYHTGKQIKIILARFAWRSHISPHTLQGTHRDGLVGIALYLAGEKFKVFRCLDGSSHQGFHFLLQALEIFWIIIIYHFLFLSFFAAKIHIFSHSQSFFFHFLHQSLKMNQFEPMLSQKFFVILQHK